MGQIKTREDSFGRLFVGVSIAYTVKGRWMRGTETLCSLSALCILTQPSRPQRSIEF